MFVFENRGLEIAARNFPLMFVRAAEKALVFHVKQSMPKLRHWFSPSNNHNKGLKMIDTKTQGLESLSTANAELVASMVVLSRTKQVWLREVEASKLGAETVEFVEDIFEELEWEACLEDAQLYNVDGSLKRGIA